jgi:hypothetical protein
MRDVKEKGEEKRKIPLCARSKVVKIKYPRTCPIHICADIISLTGYHRLTRVLYVYYD